MMKKSLAVILMFSMMLSSFTMVSAQEEASSEVYTMELLPVADAFVSRSGDPAFTKMEYGTNASKYIWPTGPYPVFRFEPSFIPNGVTSVTLDLSFLSANLGEMTFKVYEYDAKMADGTLWTNETANTADIGLPEIDTTNCIGTATIASPTSWKSSRISIPIDTEYLAKNAAFLVTVDYEATKDDGGYEATSLLTGEYTDDAYRPKLKIEYTLSAEEIEKVALSPAADAFVSRYGDPAFTKMESGTSATKDIWPTGPYPVFRFETSYIPNGVMSATFDLSFLSVNLGEMTFKVYEYDEKMDDGTLWTNETANTADIGLPEIDTTNCIGTATITSPDSWKSSRVSIPIDTAYLSKNAAFLVTVDYEATKDDGGYEGIRLLTSEYTDDAHRPKLKIEYTLGAEEIETSALSTVADAGLYFAGTGENVYTKMSSATSGHVDSYPGGPYMITRFDASDVPGNVRAGSLELTFMTSFEGEMTFNVYEYGALMADGNLWTEDKGDNTSDIGLPECVDVGFDTPIATGTFVTDDATWNTDTVKIDLPPQYLTDDDISFLVAVDYEATKDDGGHEVTRFTTREANNGYEAKLELKTSYEEIIDLGYTYDNGSGDELLNGLKNVNINKSYAITGREDINPDDILFVLALYDIAKGTLELAETDFDVDGNKLSLSIDLTDIDLDNKELNCFLWEKETLAPMVSVGQPLR